MLPCALGLMFLPCQPTTLSIFCLGLLRPNFHIFTSFGLCWLKFLLCQPFHYFIPQASSIHLLPLYLFYSHELFARSLVLHGPTYHIFTSYYFLGLLAFRSTHWVYLFISWASLVHLPLLYLFLFPWAYYFILWASLACLLFLYLFFYCCGLASHQFCHFSLLGLFLYSLTIFYFSHSLYCWASSTVGPFVKSGHQQK